jgi:WD40 repeat protein
MNFKITTKKINKNVFGDDDNENKKSAVPKSIGLSPLVSETPATSESLDDSPTEVDDDKDIAKMMGFSGFGKFCKNKTSDSNEPALKQSATQSKAFDLEKLVEENRKNARTLFGDVSEDKLDQEATDDRTVPDAENQTPSTSSDKIQDGAKPKSAKNRTTDASDDEESDEVDSDSEDDEADRYKHIPMSNQLELNHGTKTVSALAIDSEGSRFVSGGADFSVKIWDFNKMQPGQMEDLRSFEPCGCHPIKRLSFSNTGQHVIVVSGSSQAKVVDRDGQNVVECPRGDPYLRDMNRTKGHVAMLNDGCWSPRDASQFITCAGDGTVRIWSVESAATGHQTVLKVRSKAGLRALPNCLALTPDLSLLAVGSDDGSISAWDHRRQRYVNNVFSLRNVHTAGNDMTSICFSHGGNQLASRSTDGTLALWDIRTQKLLKRYESLPNRFSGTDCLFSPDDNLILTGISGEREAPDGRLVAFDTKTLTDSPVETLTLTGSSPVRLIWHARINQLLLGTSDGKVRVYYDSRQSSAGALFSTRIRSRKAGDSYKTDKAFVCAEPTVLTPHSLPMFKAVKKRTKVVQELKDRLDPIKSKRPELPVGVHGQGGRIASAGSTYAQFIARNLAIKDLHTDNGLDAREVLLRHAAEAEKNPYWIAPAYQQTQPKPIFQNNEPESDDQPPPKKIAK